MSLSGVFVLGFFWCSWLLRFWFYKHGRKSAFIQCETPENNKRLGRIVNKNRIFPASAWIAGTAERTLPRFFRDSGFRDIRASVSFEPFSTDEEIDLLHGFIIGWFLSPATVSAATEHGIATREQFDDWRRELDEWKDIPGALAAFAWGEATGRN